MRKTNPINNALAQLQMMQIAAANGRHVATSPAAQNSARKGLELAKKLNIKIPPIATALANGKSLNKSQLESIVQTFDEKGWDLPKPLNTGWMNHEQPSADWIECLLHGGASHWAIEQLQELDKPKEPEAKTKYQEVLSKSEYQRSGVAGSRS